MCFTWFDSWSPWHGLRLVLKRIAMLVNQSTRAQTGTEAHCHVGEPVYTGTRATTCSSSAILTTTISLYIQEVADAVFKMY